MASAVQSGNKTRLWLSTTLCWLAQHLGLVCLILGVGVTVPIAPPLLDCYDKKRKRKPLCPFSNEQIQRACLCHTGIPAAIFCHYHLLIC